MKEKANNKTWKRDKNQKMNATHQDYIILKIMVTEGKMFKNKNFQYIPQNIIYNII